MEEKRAIMQNIIKGNKQQNRKILSIYFIFFVSFLVAVVPLSIASLFSLMICICTLSVIYSIRSKAEEDSVMENQMTFLIRTFWRTNLYLVITFIFGAGYLVVFADYLPLKPCITYIENNLLSIAKNASMKRIGAILERCEAGFIKSNWHHLTVSVTIIILPALSYMIYRITKGAHAVFNNALIPEHKL